MREIKFRAWDNEQKQWIYPVRFSNSPTNGTLQIDHPNYFLSQYTGVKDGDGKEIYEGDILGYWGGATWEVGWDIEKGKWALIYEDGTSMSSLSTKEHLKKEVIGNVYENPELLR